MCGFFWSGRRIEWDEFVAEFSGFALHASGGAGKLMFVELTQEALIVVLLADDQMPEDA